MDLTQQSDFKIVFTGSKKNITELSVKKKNNIYILFSRDEDPEFFSTDPDPDPAQLKKNSGSGSDSGSDLKSK